MYIEIVVVASLAILAASCTWGIIDLVEGWVGLPQRHTVKHREMRVKFCRMFPTTVLLINTVEELIWRQLFLGWLPIVFGPDSIAPLFIVGNILWGLMHWNNYEGFPPRRIIPFFVLGTFLSWVFLRYGFMAVVITHFGINTMVYLWLTVTRQNTMPNQR